MDDTCGLDGNGCGVFLYWLDKWERARPVEALSPLSFSPSLSLVMVSIPLSSSLLPSSHSLSLLSLSLSNSQLRFCDIPTSFSIRFSSRSKKLSRKKGGARRSRGWVHGKSGFADDGVPLVLTSAVMALVQRVKDEKDSETLWRILDSLPPSHATWDDLITAVMLLKRNGFLHHTIQMCEWILQCQLFRPDILCYNLLLDSYGRSSQFWKAEETFVRIKEDGYIPNEDSFNIMMRAYNFAGLYDKAEELFHHMTKFGISPGIVTYNVLFDVLGKGGKAKKAEQIFKQLEKSRHEPTVNTFTQMINIYGKAGLSSKAEAVFRSMGYAKCNPNLCTYTALMNAYAREGLCDKAEAVFEELQLFGFEPDVLAYNALLQAYCCAGNMEAAGEIFSLMKVPDKVSYNILINGYIQKGHRYHKEAEAYFEAMKEAGFSPNRKSYTSILSGLARQGRVSEAEALVVEMQALGFEVDVLVLNSLLQAYGCASNLPEMERLLGIIESQVNVMSIDTYNTVMSIYVHQASSLSSSEKVEEKAEALFSSLQKKGPKPDVITWTLLMLLSAKVKRFEKCMLLMDEMVAHGCRPDATAFRVLLSSCTDPDQEDTVNELMAKTGLSKAQAGLVKV